jgi:predicted kinase
MPTLYIMCGLAFSGKSTLARKIVDYIPSDLVAFDKLWVEKDKERPVPKNADGWRYIRDLAQEKVLASLRAGNSVVYDDNNPSKEHRDEFRKVAREAEAKAIIIYLDTPLDVIKAREETNKTLKDRHDVEPENFRKVLQDMEVPTADENVVMFKSEMDVNQFLEELKHN